MEETIVLQNSESVRFLGFLIVVGGVLLLWALLYAAGYVAEKRLRRRAILRTQCAAKAARIHRD